MEWSTISKTRIDHLNHHLNHTSRLYRISHSVTAHFGSHLHAVVQGGSDKRRLTAKQRSGIVPNPATFLASNKRPSPTWVVPLGATRWNHSLDASRIAPPRDETRFAFFKFGALLSWGLFFPPDPALFGVNFQRRTGHRRLSGLSSKYVGHRVPRPLGNTHLSAQKLSQYR